MTLDAFLATLEATHPPATSALLQALWHDAKGDWDAAHHLAQDIDTPEGAWVHGYLHRKEGDIGNARYWYLRAARPEALGALDDEWRAIVTALLAGS